MRLGHVATVPVDGEQLANRVGGLLQIREGLEEGHDAEGSRVVRLPARLGRQQHARLALQQLDHEDVRGLVRHRDDVGAEGVAAQLGADAEGVEHLAGLLVHGHARGDERPLALELAHQERALLLLGPRGELAHAEVVGDRVHGLGVLGALLAEVHLHQRHAKAVHAAQQVQQAALGDRAGPGLV